ncbi:MAG: phosphoribosylformylglycinamidine synthase, partial [Bacteroidales bacterium]|nr:phosphoribosylformylglycinamidine synthase [Bacteroidales bacterium]
MENCGKILFFKTNSNTIIAVDSRSKQSDENISALKWLFSDAELLDCDRLVGYFIGPRREMITPWSTTAVEITLNMNISGIARIEEFFIVESADAEYDKMLQRIYSGLDQDIFKIDLKPADIIHITDFEAYNKEEGLALSKDEIEYLEKLSAKLGRPLTDSEVFGFSQVNSEHCRHKIFNGTFIIDGVEKPSTLFKLIKKTTQTNPNGVVSAYK